MRGPTMFLAQFAGAKPPFDKLETTCDHFAASPTHSIVHARILGLDQ